ncbi:MAG: hypothetical protein ACFE0P_11255 [Oceanicaulis sp.]
MIRILLAAAAAPALFACAEPDPPADPTPTEDRAQAQADSRSDTRSTADASPRSGAGTRDEAEMEDGTDIPAPSNASPGDPRTIEAAYLIGPWTAKGGDCARPDFDISETPGAEPLTIETSLDGAPRTGEVRTGSDSTFVFDQPRTEFALEKRRAQALAVLPPAGGAIDLGGRTIGGDGVVFIKCAEEYVDDEPGGEER